MSGSVSIPLTLTSAGPAPTPPATLNDTLISEATDLNPTLTTDLPGSLIEDLASTGTGALVVIDQARVDAVNSVTPIGANPFILAALGQQFGIPQGIGSNASVDVQFTGSAGYVIQPGFTISDGTNQYTVQNGTVIPESGPSPQVTAVATNNGTFAIPAGTVTQVITSVPTGYTVNVTNPQAGVPLTAPQTVPAYRSQVMTAGIVASTGTPNYLKTLLYAITGVQPNLVAVRSVTGGWQVICGGGNTYAIAGAILQAVPDIATLQGSTVSSSRNVTVSLFQNPDTYNIVYVNPPQQVVTVAVTWNTTLPNFTAGTSVAQLGAPAIQNYINSIYVGQPINELEMTAAFQNAVASVLPTVNLTTLEFVVTINGTIVSPSAGTSIIVGDSEGYFYCSATGVTITQG
jgi:hypothetical protein